MYWNFKKWSDLCNNTISISIFWYNVFFSRVKCYCTYILIGLQCQIPCLLDKRSVHDKETHLIRCRKSKHTQAWWRYPFYHIVTSPGLLMHNFMLKLCYYLKVHLLCPEMKLEINKWETKRLVTGSCKITRFCYNICACSFTSEAVHDRINKNWNFMFFDVFFYFGIFTYLSLDYQCWRLSVLCHGTLLWLLGNMSC